MYFFTVYESVSREKGDDLDDAKSKKQAVSEHLRRGILTLHFSPGSDLDEMQLAQEFGLSRTPLREVLRELAGEGYLTLRPNRGARVSDMSFATMGGFFQAAPMIYGAILRMAATHATRKQIIELKAAQDAFRASLSDPDAAARALANNRFHEITGEMAHNRYLLPSFQRLLIDHARLSMTFYDPAQSTLETERALACEQHDAIIAAIEARDADAAAQLATDHWNLSRDQIQMFVFPDALDLPLGAPFQQMSA